MGSELRCRETVPPVVMLQAHSAPLGICFDTYLPFAEEMLLVAFHGSWNRRLPTGYKLVGIPFEEGLPAGPVRDIVSGWLVDGEAWGRPVAPLVGPGGTLYLSDDRAGTIYKITWP